MYKLSIIGINLIGIIMIIGLCIIPFLFLKKDMDIIKKHKHINNTIINK